jgi:hypothetical protein
MSRLVMAGTNRVKTPRQTPAQARIEYEAVTQRDKTCQAPIIDPGCDPCSGKLTREHVRYRPAMGGRRITVREGMLIICWHHALDGWCTSHKQDERDHLAKIANPR